MWFARFYILLNEPQSIWCKLLALSWLYETLEKKDLLIFVTLQSKVIELKTNLGL